MFLPWALLPQLVVFTNLVAVLQWSQVQYPLTNVWHMQGFINWATKPTLLVIPFLVLFFSRWNHTSIFKFTFLLAPVSFCYTAAGKNRFVLEPLGHRKVNVGLENTLAGIHPLLLVGATITIIMMFWFCFLESVVQNRTLCTRSVATKLKTILFIYGTSFVLSCLWAYQELFWGSFWNWDPVEFSGLLMLLFFGESVHRFIKARQRFNLHLSVWVIVVATSSCAFFCLNKGPVAQSVHSFAGSFFNTIGWTLLKIVNLALIFPLIALAAVLRGWNGRHGKPTHFSGRLVECTLLLYVVSAALAVIPDTGIQLLSASVFHNLQFKFLTLATMYSTPRLWARIFNTCWHTARHVPHHHTWTLLLVATVIVANTFKNGNLFTIQVISTAMDSTLYHNGTLTEMRGVSSNHQWSAIVYQQHPHLPHQQFKNLSNHNSSYLNFTVTTLIRPGSNLSYVHFTDKIL